MTKQEHNKLVEMAEKAATDAFNAQPFEISYHAAMELMNNPNFTPKTILGQFISMLQGLFNDGAQWPARAPHLLPV